MRLRFGILVGLFAAIAVGLGLAFRADRHAARLRADLEASLQSQAALLRDFTDQRRRAANSAAAAVRPKLPVKRMPIALTDSPSLNIANQARLREIRVIRSNLDLTRRSFLTKLGLSDEQIARWESGEAECRQSIRDLAESAAQQKLPADDPGIVALRKALEDEWKAQEAEIVGPKAQASIGDFNRTMPAAYLLTELAGSVATSSQPMTDQQGDQIRQMIAGASGTYQLGGLVVPDAVNWDSVFAAAQKVLSDSQLAAFRNVVSDQQVRSQLRQRVTALRTQP